MSNVMQTVVPVAKPGWLSRRWVQLAGVGVLALVVGVAIGGAGGAQPTTPAAAPVAKQEPVDVTSIQAAAKLAGLEEGLAQGKADAAAALAGREAAVKSAQSALATREAAVAGAEKAAKASTITEGTWTVGVDVKAGKYRPTAAVTADMSCYWGIYKSGTNGDDIIANDNVTGGFPTVTLRAGQDFTTSSCGDWRKIG